MLSSISLIGATLRIACRRHCPRASHKISLLGCAISDNRTTMKRRVEDTSASLTLLSSQLSRERYGAVGKRTSRVKPFQSIYASDLTSSCLQNEVSSKGYALIRDVLPAESVNSLLSDVTQVLYTEGWLLPEHNAIDRIANIGAACGDPDPTFKRVYQDIFNLELFHALPHHPALQRVMKMLVGDRLLIHPKPIGRLIFPNCERLVVHSHQDYQFMGGDTEFFTAWIPLHDCPVNVGPLRILEGSHRFGFQNHQKENLHVPEIPVGAEVGDEWVSGQINAGDVLIFHSLTVHAASPNSSNTLRLSLDCRFQDFSRAFNPSNVVFAGDSGKSWEKTYAAWHSDSLKYYWKKLPLAFQPSRSEIVRLAETSDSSSARAKYARIASQLD